MLIAARLGKIGGVADVLHPFAGQSNLPARMVMPTDGRPHGFVDQEAAGVAARTPGILTYPDLRKEFTGSPTVGHILCVMPVFLMDDQNSGLWGVAFYGQQLLKKG